MTELLSAIQATETWKRWGKRYVRSLRGLGKEPFKEAEAFLEAIPPDTFSSLMNDLRQGTDTVPFSNIATELAPYKIDSALNECTAWGDVAIMWFILRN